jgi:hypothetical protein
MALARGAFPAGPAYGAQSVVTWAVSGPYRTSRGGAGPGTGGVFVSNYDEERIRDGKADGVFPDAKTLKQRAPNHPGRDLTPALSPRPRGKSRSEIMTERTPPPLAVDPDTRRAHQLDALAAVLPMDRQDRLAQLLTDHDVETLKHLAREGHG